MIRPEQIPDEVVEAGAEACADAEFWAGYWITLEKDSNESAVYQKQARAGIAAAINAWPSGAVCHYRMGDSEGLEMVLPLPFPQEKQDD